MKLVIFGLTISSSWGNGHATLWRALCRALARRGHRVVFFERNVAYYAAHRDLTDFDGGELVLYDDWEDACEAARRHAGEADVAMVTSYCPDAIQASDVALASPAAVRAFYDLDTPITLGHVEAGEPPAYLPPRGLGDFDLVLSYTGGGALEKTRDLLGAARVVPLYGSVDPEAHHPVPPQEAYRADLSYLGTYAADRQEALNRLFVEASRHLPAQRFLIGGAQYPQDFPWTQNIYFVRHMPPSMHPAFFCSGRLTLNITRRAMAERGYCPSGRLFEAAGCGAPVLSDSWEGLEAFFTPDEEILIARTTDDTIAALELPEARLKRIARAARERVLGSHTADHRAADFEAAIEATLSEPAGRGRGRVAGPPLEMEA
jgi:spore maturation protein CgeB